MGAALFVVTDGSISRLVTLAFRHDVCLHVNIFHLSGIDCQLVSFLMCSEVILYHLKPFYFLQALHIATDETSVSPTNCIELQLLRSGGEADSFYPNCRPVVLNAHIIHTFYLKHEGHAEENLGKVVGEYWCQSLHLLRGK